VRRPIRTAARYFQRPAVVKVPRYRAANCDNADNLLTVVDSYPEFPPLRRNVVAVVASDKIASLAKFNRLNLERHSTASTLHPAQVRL